MDLFKLLGTITVDNADANNALDETSQKGEKAKGKLSKAFSTIGKGAAVVGKTVATGLAAGGAAMGALTVKALNMSGELEQNMGGSEAVFGKYAGKMQDTAKTAFSNMGLSTSDYLATANKMGALFQGAGFSIKDSMDLSSGAMQRAADVASIMGIDTSAAMEAIAGAAKGNFTMMDNLGVAMNDTTLQAYALEKGIKKSTSEMTNQEKIGLAMEMFMEKTAYAAGNYAKENETLAGSLGTAKAALTNFLDGSGSVEDLVNAFSSAANVIVKNLKTLAPRLISGITDIINQIIPMLPPLLQEILPVLIEGAVSLINGIVEAMPTIISAIMAALPALIEGIQQIINALIQALPQIIQALVAALPNLIPLLVNALVSMIVMLCTMLPQIIQPIIDYLPEIMVSIATAIAENFPALLQGVWELVKGIVAAFPQFLQAMLEGLTTIFTGILNKIAEFSTPLVEGFKNLMNAIKSGLSTAWNAIKTAVSTVLNGIKNIVTTVWNGIKSAVSTAVNAIKGVVTTVWNAIKSAISTVINAIKSTVSNVFNSIKSTVSSIFNGIKTAATTVWNAIKTTISIAVNSAKSTVTSVFNGIKSAITSPVETAKNKVKQAVNSITGFFKNMKISFPKIKLPHFKVSGKLSISPPSVPKLSIQWYKKAMNNPMIMNDPTIFGYNPANGSFMGGGEAGSEVVSGTSTLMRMIQAAVASENSAVVYYLQKLIEILADYFPQFLEALDFDLGFDADLFIKRHAPKIDKQLGIIQKNKERGRA